MLKYFISPANQIPNPKKPSVGGYDYHPDLDYGIITHKVSCVVRHSIEGNNMTADVYVFSDYEDEFLVMESAVEFLKKIFDGVRFVSLQSYVGNYMQLDK